MRIGVLEWASAGGGHIGQWRARSKQGSDPLPSSIVAEGWAMTRSLCQSLCQSGVAVEVVLVDALREKADEQTWANHVHVTPLSPQCPIKRQWQNVYSRCDRTLIIAPECDDILAQLLLWCERRGLATCNATVDFVRQAADKLACARAWKRAGLPQPPTRGLERVDQLWLNKISDQRRPASENEPLWIIKPRDGVGCDGLRRLTTDQLMRFNRIEVKHRRASRWIVQPWVDGIHCSRAAIIDAAGTKHWLPVLQQRLVFPSDQVAYRGGRSMTNPIKDTQGLTAILNQAVDSLGSGARGWIGVDFLFHPDRESSRDAITLIEVNPRLTTSFVGLMQSGQFDLANQLVAAATGREVRLAGEWPELEFAAE